MKDVEKGTIVQCWDGDNKPDMPFIAYYIRKRKDQHVVKFGSDCTPSFFSHVEPLFKEK
jgi:hypothetical protein